MNEKNTVDSTINLEELDEKAIDEYCDAMYREGRKDKASDVAERLLKKVPDWSDERIARVVEVLSLEDISKLRNDIKPD